MQLTTFDSQNSDSIYREILDTCRHPLATEREDLEVLEAKMHSILDYLSFTNKLVCIKEVSDLLKKHRYHFLKEPMIDVLIADTKEKIQVPSSLVFHSQTLQDQIEEEDLEPPMISLPWGFTKEEFERCTHFLGEKPEPILDLAAWLRVRITAERFSCDERIIHNNLSNKEPRWTGTLEELETAISSFDSLHSVLTGSIVSQYLSAFMYTSLKTRTMREVCDTLNSSELVKACIHQIPINFHPGEAITLDALQILASTITNVVSLKLDISDVTVFPNLWENTLQKLSIRSKQINQIPETLLSRVQELCLWTKLQDYTVLNNRLNLKILHLGNIDDIISVPSGLSNLKEFSVTYCSRLRDFSPLTGLQSLEVCNFWGTPITAVPSGLANLRNFYVTNCSELRDLSGLNNLQFLEVCRFSDVPITAIPSGLSRLKKVVASHCSELRDLSGLNNLQFLENCYFSDTPITAAPSGNPKLKTFTADSCPLLADASGLRTLEPKNVVITRQNYTPPIDPF